MKLAVWLCLLMLAATAGWFAFIRHCPIAGGFDEFAKAYVAGARAPLFSGFLTLAGFLLTLSAVTLGRVKDALDTEENERKFYRDSPEVPSGKTDASTYYHDVKTLARQLATAIICSLLTSAIQLTLGFWMLPIPISFCAGSATLTLGFVVCLTLKMLFLQLGWVKQLSEKKTEELNKKEVASVEANQKWLQEEESRSKAWREQKPAPQNTGAKRKKKS